MIKSKTLIKIRDLEVDGRPSRENIVGQSALLMNGTLLILFFPKGIYKFIK